MCIRDRSQGFFAEEGLSVELTVGQGADKVMAAVLSGSVDIGLAGPEAAKMCIRDRFITILI